LFQQNCQTCHALDKKLTGPPSRNFAARGPGEQKENIHQWIANPSAFIENDNYTQNLQKEYVLLMPAFSGLKSEEIEQIIAYLNEFPAQ